MKLLSLSFVLIAMLGSVSCSRQSAGPGTPAEAASSGDVRPGTVIISGGHETDPVDNGRPCVLIAAALGVETQVFRDAFSGVTPARHGHPTESRARSNKEALMSVLGKYGITNDRLDDVSDYYRYRPQAGELWKHTPASAEAVIENGEVTGFRILDAGSGYIGAPSVKVVGHEDLKVDVTVEFSTEMELNGRVTAIEIVE